MQLKFLYSRDEESNAKTFFFEAVDGLSWQAGQYLIYKLEHSPKDLRGKMRFFTISSAPFEKTLSITTRISSKNGSTFKKALLNLKKGDEVEVKGPDGDFVLDDEYKKYVFLAGGIGINPYRSILKQLNRESMVKGQWSMVDITLLYSNSDSDFIYKKELDGYAKNNPKLNIAYIVSPKRIDKKMISKYLDKKTMFYVSGPDPMVEAMEKLLNEMNIDKKRIKSDYFSGY